MKCSSKYSSKYEIKKIKNLKYYSDENIKNVAFIYKKKKLYFILTVNYKIEIFSKIVIVFEIMKGFYDKKIALHKDK